VPAVRLLVSPGGLEHVLFGVSGCAPVSASGGGGAMKYSTMHLMSTEEPRGLTPFEVDRLWRDEHTRIRRRKRLHRAMRGAV
jgi:hypothetical protein